MSTLAFFLSFRFLLRWQDSNLRPSGYEPDELPTAPHRDPFSRIGTAKIVLSSFFARTNFTSVSETIASAEHKAGFVNIIGSPNVGKSTLMNRLVGERLSIINAKAQTTRHRIMGIVSGDAWQIVYSDTPGVLDPAYKLQEGMMKFVRPHSGMPTSY